MRYYIIIGWDEIKQLVDKVHDKKCILNSGYVYVPAENDSEIFGLEKKLEDKYEWWSPFLKKKTKKDIEKTEEFTLEFVTVSEEEVQSLGSRELGQQEKPKEEPIPEPVVVKSLWGTRVELTGG